MRTSSLWLSRLKVFQRKNYALCRRLYLLFLLHLLLFIRTALCFCPLPNTHSHCALLCGLFCNILFLDTRSCPLSAPLYNPFGRPCPRLSTHRSPNLCNLPMVIPQNAVGRLSCSLLNAHFVFCKSSHSAFFS